MKKYCGITGACIAALLAAAAAGPAAADWVAYPDEGAVVVRPFSGGALGGPLYICGSGASFLPAAPALNAAGDPSVAWVGEDGGIFFSSLEGGEWSPAEEAVSPDGLHRGVPSLIAGDKGSAVLAWAESAPGGFEDVYYAVRERGRWSAPVRAHAPNGVPDIMPRLAAGADGGFSLSWKRLEGDRYVDVTAGADVPPPPEEEPPAGFLEAAHNASLPLQAVVAWRGGDGGSRSAYLKEIEDGEARLSAAAAAAEDARLRADTGARVSERAEFTVVCFGDSITYGRGSSSNGPRTGYPAYLQAILDYDYPGHSFRVVNEGNPGERTSGGLSRIGDVLSDENPDSILIMEGTNDIYFGVSFETIQENLKQMAFTASKRGVLPILATIIPTHPSRRPQEYQRTKSFYLGRYVQTLKDHYGIHYVDQWNAFVTVPDFADVIMNPNPGNHPNDNGYRYVMAPTWFDEVAPYVNIPFTPTEVGLSLSESATGVARGSGISFSYAVAPSNDIVRNAVDCYVAVRDPLGRFYFVDRGGALMTRTTALVSKVLLHTVPSSGSLVNISIPPGSPTGTYTLLAVTVRSLRDVWNGDYWTSGLSTIDFEVW